MRFWEIITLMHPDSPLIWDVTILLAYMIVSVALTAQLASVTQRGETDKLVQALRYGRFHCESMHSHHVIRSHLSSGAPIVYQPGSNALVHAYRFCRSRRGDHNRTRSRLRSYRQGFC